MQEEGQQPRIRGKLSVSDAVKLALVHNKMLQQTLEERTVAEGQIVSSRSAYLPGVTLSTQYRREELVPSFDIAFPGAPPEHVQIGTLNSYSAALTVTQPLYAGGAITAQVQLARLSSLLADQTIRAATQDVVYATENAYYNLLLSQHLVDIGTEEVRAARAHLEDVQKKRAGGVVSDYDVLRAQVELSNSEANLIRSKNAINIARANLIKTLGIAQESDFTLSDEFVYAPVKFSMEEAVKTAFTNRPDLYSNEYQIRELTQAILSVENAEEFVQSQRLNVERATEGLRLADVGYQQGIKTQVEVIDAQSAVTQARVNYLQAIYQHVVAKLAVQRAMGTIVETYTADVSAAQKTQAGSKPQPEKRSPDAGSKEQDK